MAVAVNRLSLKGEMLPPHLAEGREPYALAAALHQVPERVYWADTFTEMVSLLTRTGTDYLTEVDGAVRLDIRATYALGAQIQMQAFANTYAQMHSDDWSSLAAWEKQVFLGRRTLDEQPHDWPTRHLLDGVDLWSASVPLYVLSGTGRGEHILLSDNGSLVVLDAFNDEALVRSLADGGYLRLWTATPASD
jgi:hypothetical protein